MPGHLPRRGHLRCQMIPSCQEKKSSDMEYADAFLCGGGALPDRAAAHRQDTSHSGPVSWSSMWSSGVVLGGAGSTRMLVELGRSGATVPLTGFRLSAGQGACARPWTEHGHSWGALTGGVTAAAGGIYRRHLLRLCWWPRSLQPKPESR
ncbi:MAG: SpoVA/SpoVAEb family sporulation membrane protein [Flavonifractor plautii]